MSKPLSRAELDEVRAALKTHGTLAAVKRYRELADCELLVAKQAVDDLQVDDHARLPELHQRSRTGCFGVLLVGSLLGTALAAWAGG